MLWNFLILIADVACVLIAFAAVAICLTTLIIWNKDKNPGGAQTYYYSEDDKLIRYGTLVVLLSSIVFILAEQGARILYLHLVSEAPYMFQLFGIWYGIGFASRFLLLVRRHWVFSPIFATDWEAVLGALFYALGGPFVTIHLLKELVRGQ